MGFKVLLGGINPAEMLSWGQRWRPAPTPLVDNGPQSLSLGCTLGIKYLFKSTYYIYRKVTVAPGRKEMPDRWLSAQWERVCGGMG